MFCNTRTLFSELETPQISREESSCGDDRDCSEGSDSEEESSDYDESEEESGSYEDSSNNS